MLKARWKKHTLNFKFEAGTSRGILKQKDSWFILLENKNNPGIIGIGECAPLIGLSPDDLFSMESKLTKVCHDLNKFSLSALEIPIREIIEAFSLHHFPSILFGLETAILDLYHGGKKQLLPSSFYEGTQAIPINGLIWMGDIDFMKSQLEEKIEQEYTCIKLKIGAIDFTTELKLIESIRRNHSTKDITIRLDANGAFSFQEAKEKLSILADYDIHSIEQPICAGNEKQMAELCHTSPIAIALDEELIGIKSYEEKLNLLISIRPQYIILKPTLVGGLSLCKEWIELAESLNIGWWITSALETNIGLNAISQFTATWNKKIPQGLGTGQLYHNNINSPLVIQNGFLYYDPKKMWDLTIF
jgi:o-succinylbenzoate synthase